MNDPRPPSSAGNDRGLTLIEFAVAILVLALGSLAAMQGLDQSRVAIGGALPRALAQEVLRNRVEEWRLYGTAASALPQQVRMAGQAFQIETNRQTTTAGLIRLELRAVALDSDGEGALLVTYLPNLPPLPPGPERSQ